MIQLYSYYLYVCWLIYTIIELLNFYTKLGYCEKITPKLISYN